MSWTTRASIALLGFVFTASAGFAQYSNTVRNFYDYAADWINRRFY